MLIGDLYLGKVDGKFEFLEPNNAHEEGIHTAYLIPENVNPKRFGNHDQYFVSGFRGTGKTSLLRWFAENRRKDGSLTEFVLFKSTITEEQRSNLSSEVGYTYVSLEAEKMEFSQDFKTAWTWFAIHKIGEALGRHPKASTQASFLKLSKILGLHTSAFKKVMGILPKLDKMNVSITADIDFFKAEFGGEFEANKESGVVTLDSLNRKCLAYLEKISLDADVYIFFDELEVFYDEPSKFVRDQRMVRDLLFVVSTLNERFRSTCPFIHILAAVRSEVLDGLGALGQEIERPVHDKGVELSWHDSRRSIDHPLFKMIAQKIQLSDQECINLGTQEVIQKYFPGRIQVDSIEAYLLDRSFYRPRDLIWRLTIAQKQFPKASSFNEQVLRDTEQKFSGQMWDEIAYELSAHYTREEIDVITMALSGFSVEFFMTDIQARFESLSYSSINARKFLSSRGIADVMRDLYRLGAVGNFFRVGKRASDVRNRWAFRGASDLLTDKKMTINPSLLKRLSMVQRKR